MKKICFFLIPFLFISSSVFSLEGSLKLTTYYPSPIGRYQTLRLFPLTNAPGCDSDHIGLIYYNDSKDVLELCTINGTTGLAQAIELNINLPAGGQIWDLSGPDLYTQDSSYKAGIGTETPNSSLQINGAVSRSGTTLSDISQVNLGINSVTGSEHSTVSGGEANSATGKYSLVSGGKNNQATGYGSAISGGENNQATGLYALISGGLDNIAETEWHPTISGGSNNYVNNKNAAVTGGDQNKAEGEYSSVLGGRANTASGNFSFIPGTCTNTAEVDYSFAAGKSAHAGHQGSFVWADYQYGSASPPEYESSEQDTFNIRAMNGIYFGGGASSDLDIADVAEFMDAVSEDNIQEGELVSVFEDDLLSRSKKEYDESLIGVVSSRETMTVHLGLSDSDKTGVSRLPIVLAGRAMVKVNDQAGPIKSGDPITSSSVPGTGMRAVKPGKIIGYALENEKFTDNDTSVIIVFVSLGYYSGEKGLAFLRKAVSDLEKDINLNEAGKK